MVAPVHRVGHVIFGGGVAGLWLLDALRRDGHDAVLLESRALGAGQTIWSQGIIHGGVKYTLDGLMNASANAIRDMPSLWRECLAGRGTPDLSSVRVRSEHCHLWRTDTIASRLGMIGARVGLRTASESVESVDRPAVLRDCPGTVARVAEPVIDTVSLLEVLSAPHADCILQYDAGSLTAERTEDAGLRIGVRDIDGGRTLVLEPAGLVFLTAGGGNADLAGRFGIPGSEGEMQVRPLHMVMVRGDVSALPELYGHCVDGARTRVTVTSAMDRAGRRVWQVGGEIAERGVAMSGAELVALAKRELEDVIPGFDSKRFEFGTYLAPRAEMANQGKRPESFGVVMSGEVVSAWPTKLVLAPLLAESLCKLAKASPRTAHDAGRFQAWPRPGVALPAWETCEQWMR